MSKSKKTKNTKTTTVKSDVKEPKTLIPKVLFEKSSNDANGNDLIVRALKLNDNPVHLVFQRVVKSRKDEKDTKLHTASRIKAEEWSFLASIQKDVQKVLDEDAKVVKAFLEKKAAEEKKAADAKVKKAAALAKKAKAEEKAKDDAPTEEKVAATA